MLMQDGSLHPDKLGKDASASESTLTCGVRCARESGQGLIRRDRRRVGLRWRDRRLPPRGGGQARLRPRARPALRPRGLPGRARDNAPSCVWHSSRIRGGMFDVRLMRDVVVITRRGRRRRLARLRQRAAAGAGRRLRRPATGRRRSPRRALEPWYDRTEDGAAAGRPTPPDPALSQGARRSRRRAPRRAASAEPLPIAVHFGEAREHPFSGVPQEGCENLGRCDIGCPVHAKNTVDITYVARAESARRRGAARSTRPSASSRPSRTGGKWRRRLRATWSSGRDGSRRGARPLVLAAGTLGSPRLLLKNRRRLPGLSPALGTRFSGNGDALGIAFDPNAPDVSDARNDFGPVMTSALDYTADRRLIARRRRAAARLRRRSSTSPAASNVIRGWRRWLAARCATLARAPRLDRPGAAPARRCARSTSADSPNQDALIFLMIGRDAADGRMRLTPLFRRFDIRWSKAGSAAAVRPTSSRPRASSARRRRGDAVLRARGRSARASSRPCTRSAAARWPTTPRTASSTTPGASTASRASTCSTARSSRRRSA